MPICESRDIADLITTALCSGVGWGMTLEDELQRGFEQDAIRLSVGIAVDACRRQGRERPG